MKVLLTATGLIVFGLLSYWTYGMREDAGAGSHDTATSRGPAAGRASARPPERVNEPIQPIPLQVELDPRKVDLGRRLFADVRLSVDDSVSCATCHDLARGGADGKARPAAFRGGSASVNTPTVFNSGFNFRQFWDGRAATLEDQVDGPMLSPVEMGMDWEHVIKKVAGVPEYAAAFDTLYRGGVNASNIKDAIATFERSLFTPNARFDRFLRGDTSAITREELDGYALFKDYGCIACHQGMNVGGNMFQKMGVMKENPAEGETGTDAGVLKVPSLRNVVLTAPYFHDGSAPTLEDAVSTMGTYQLGRVLSKEEVRGIVDFLGTLTGEFGRKGL